MIRSTAILIILFLISSNTLAQSPNQPASRPETYEGLLALGHTQYINQSYDEAMVHYEAAKNVDPGKPDAYYFIGCTLKQQKKYQNAVSMLASAATVAGDTSPSMHAKALFVIAVTWEVALNLEKAKYAWIDYKSFAAIHPEANPFTTVANERGEAINVWLKRLEEYEIVKQRISASVEKTTE